MNIVELTNTLERLDLMIRMKNTGNLSEISKKLEVSISTVKRIIELMKIMGAPIIFSHVRRSYIYEYGVYYFHGFVEEQEYKSYQKSNSD